MYESERAGVVAGDSDGQIPRRIGNRLRFSPSESSRGVGREEGTTSEPASFAIGRQRGLRRFGQRDRQLEASGHSIHIPPIVTTYFVRRRLATAPQPRKRSQEARAGLFDLWGYSAFLRSSDVRFIVGVPIPRECRSGRDTSNRSNNDRRPAEDWC